VTGARLVPQLLFISVVITLESIFSYAVSPRNNFVALNANAS
jgi:hypothetical protein